MMVNKEIEILDGLPLIHIKSMSAIACSDLHLGYEGVMADRGVFLPKANLKSIKESIKLAVDSVNPRSIIIDGDIKNEFSKVHLEEFNEFRELCVYLKEDLELENIILIKGNHDNFIERLKEPIGFKMYYQEGLISKMLFFHGEDKPMAKSGYTHMIMGHLHPSIALFNSVGIKEKLKCFLSGKTKRGKYILILPAMNYFAPGVDVNMEEDISGLAPIFRNMLDVDEMDAYCIGEGETLEFGKVGALRYQR